MKVRNFRAMARKWLDTMKAYKIRAGWKFVAIERGLLLRWRGQPFQRVLRQLAEIWRAKQEIAPANLKPCARA